jgi:hypothetical protein
MTTEREKTSNAENISAGLDRGRISANLRSKVSSAQMINMVIKVMKIQTDLL